MPHSSIMVSSQLHIGCYMNVVTKQLYGGNKYNPVRKNNLFNGDGSEKSALFLAIVSYFLITIWHMLFCYFF